MEFGSWTVLERKPVRKGNLYYWCRCKCGLEKLVRESHLQGGRSQGCRKCRAHLKKHGKSATAEHGVWRGMLNRCRPEHASAKNYYDRGIRVCSEWQGSVGFERFLAHVGERPSKKHSIDRIDNDRGYEPGNVRWADAVTQANNQRKTRFVTIGNETKPLTEWARIANVKPHIIHNRLNRGASPSDAVFRPAAVVTPIKTGDTFRAWTVLGPSERRGCRGEYYLCRCQCGKEKFVRDTHLRGGTSTKCSRWCRVGS